MYSFFFSLLFRLVLLCSEWAGNRHIRWWVVATFLFPVGIHLFLP